MLLRARPELLQQVPLLNDAKNVEEIGDGVLVRFRGMIQNVMNLEFYVKSVKTKEERVGDVLGEVLAMTSIADGRGQASFLQV